MGKCLCLFLFWAYDIDDIWIHDYNSKYKIFSLSKKNMLIFEAFSARSFNIYEK